MRFFIKRRVEESSGYDTIDDMIVDMIVDIYPKAKISKFEKKFSNTHEFITIV